MTKEAVVIGNTWRLQTLKVNDTLPQVAQGGYDCKDKVEILPSQPEVREKKFADNFCLGKIGVQSSAQQSIGHEGQDGQPVGKSKTGRKDLEQAKGDGLGSI